MGLDLNRTIELYVIKIPIRAFITSSDVRDESKRTGRLRKISF